MPTKKSAGSRSLDGSGKKSASRLGPPKSRNVKPPEQVDREIALVTVDLGAQAVANNRELAVATVSLLGHVRSAKDVPQLNNREDKIKGLLVAGIRVISLADGTDICPHDGKIKTRQRGPNDPIDPCWCGRSGLAAETM